MEAVTKARERRDRLLTLVRHLGPVRGAMTAGELARFTKHDPDPLSPLLAQRLLEGMALDGRLARVPCGARIVAYRLPHIAQEIAS